MSREFKRGDVFHAYVPEMNHTPQSPPPSYVLQGKHYFVMLHDSAEQDIPSRVAVAAPITSAKSLRGKRDMPESFVPLDRQRHPFLSHDSFISTHQVMPLSRHWLAQVPVGQIHPGKLVSLDLQLVRTLGLNDLVQTMVKNQLVERMKEFQQGLEQAAPTRTPELDR